MNINYSAFNANLIAGIVAELEQQGADFFFRDGADSIKVAFDSPSNDFVPLKVGETAETSGFSKMYILSAVSQVVSLIVAPAGEIKVSGAPAVSDVVVKRDVAPIAGNNGRMTLVNANQDYAVFAADVMRKESVLQADKTNAANIFVGILGSSIADGLELGPGETAVFSNGCAVSARCTGAGQSLRFMEFLWS